MYFEKPVKKEHSYETPLLSNKTEAKASTYEKSYDLNMLVYMHKHKIIKIYI